MTMEDRGGKDPKGVAFRRLAIATVVCIFALVVLGGVVRVTESGLGCPDWPLCHGRVVPSGGVHTFIEYSHRMVASVVGLLVVGVAVVAWRSYRHRRWVVVPAAVGLVLVVVQVVLGGVTVLRELESGVVMAHLAVAEVLVATMTLVALATWKEMRWSETSFSGLRLNPFVPLAALTAIVAYLLLLSGSYTTVSGASGICGGWPLCNEQLWPGTRLEQVHMAHRFLAALVGVLVLATASLAWRSRRIRPDLAGVSLLVVGVFAAQVIVGALTIWWGLPMAARALHLAMGTAAWIAIVVLAILPHTPAQGVPKQVSLEADALTELRRAMS